MSFASGRYAFSRAAMSSLTIFSIASVTRLDRSKAFLLQHDTNRVAQAFVVVNHENRLHSEQP